MEKKEERKEKNGPFCTKKGSFLKSASNYILHIRFTPESFALYLEVKYFCYTLWGEIKADANGPQFGGFVVTRGSGKEIHDFENSPLGSFYFPRSKQTAESLFRVTLKKGHTSKTVLEPTTGSLREYKAIHYLFLKELNEWWFPWPPSL